ncbi:MAG: hypothetical protein QOC77_1701 [Thermoleophilaceae bacterium]|jgi:hypothetical protein|nr:hypothetical protein [Thermoleophilaceae bacterium]
MDAYVYGVTRAGAVERSPGEGIDGQAVEVATHGELAALVSDAPNVPVKASKRNLMAHSRVLQAVIADTCVLPMQFGVVMPGREAVEHELLAANAERLAEHLHILDPYVELDVRALCVEHVLLQAVVDERSDIARLRASLEGRPVESTYHESIRLGEMVAHAVAEKRAEVAHRILAQLEPLAAAAEPGDALHEQMVANVAFLVERGRVPEFDAAVDALGRELVDPEVRVRYLGPLPPHNFVDLASETEAREWA